MDGIAQRNAGFLKRLFEETAERMDLDPPIIEKDFWVCWTLNCLFGMPDLKENLIFRGGTSLSKVYNLIYRFSEDIDLTLNRALFGYGGDEDPAKFLSTKRREKSIGRMVESCGHYIGSEILPNLRATFSTKLQSQPESWDIAVDTEDEDGQSLLFFYPRASGSVVRSYVNPAVKLEFGSRAEPWPTQIVNIRPYAAEYFPDVFTRNIECEVVALSAERAFWEKATILHQEANRPEDKRMQRCYFRHYYDLAMMAQSPVAMKAINDIKLLEAVTKHKQLFFRCAWAKFDKAKPGMLRLIPPDFRFRELKKDFRDMEPMLFGDYPSFQGIMDILTELELKINLKEQ